MRALFVTLAAAGSAWLVAWLVSVGLRLGARGRAERFVRKLKVSVQRPLVVLLFFAALLVAHPFTFLTGQARGGLRHGLVLAVIGSGAWLAVKVLFVAEDTAFRRLPVDVRDNRRTRRARTQIGLLRRLTAVVITLIAIALALITFAPLRAFGASLLASAGVVGVIAGLAARTTLGHVFAGLQLAFTDALRLDDVVVVEHEWGRIEEIKLTQVVVRLWDERRLVLPTTFFTDTPFQNWTRNESLVLGAVTFFLDYSAPVDQLRKEVHRIVEESPLWDRREWVLQVVDTTQTTMVVRVLVSAADSASAWDLRCDVREKLIAYVQEHCPDGLPRVRAELDHPGGRPARGATGR